MNESLWIAYFVALGIPFSIALFMVLWDRWRDRK